HYRFPKGFPYLLGLMLLESALWAHHLVWAMMVPALLYAILPGLFLNALIYLIFAQRGERTAVDPRYRVKLGLIGGKLTLANIRRGVSIIGSAGSGKTESVVLALMKHFKKQAFCGIIHDYKHFELTE